MIINQLGVDIYLEYLPTHNMTEIYPSTYIKILFKININ